MGDNAVPADFVAEGLSDSTLSGWTKGASRPSRGRLLTFLAISNVPHQDWPRWLAAVARVEARGPLTPEVALTTDERVLPSTVPAPPSTEEPRYAEPTAVEAAGPPAETPAPEDARPPLPEPSAARPPARKRLPRRAILLTGVVAAIIVVVTIVALLWNGARNPEPPSASAEPSPTVGVDRVSSDPVAFFRPLVDRLRPGGNVLLTVRITGLSGRALWILEQPADSPERFTISSRAAITRQDGEWPFTSTAVGEDPGTCQGR